MQAQSNPGAAGVVLSPDHRIRLEAELDLYLEMKMDERSGLAAIEDREIVFDGWAVLDMLAGRDFDRTRVRRVVAEMSADIDRDLTTDSEGGVDEHLRDFIDHQLDGRVAATTVLAQVGEGR